MTRPYSDKFLLHLEKTESLSEGVELAKLCVQAKLPIIYLASALGVSRWTLHKWFRGENIHPRNLKKVERASTTIRNALKKGDLPSLSRHKAISFVNLNIK